MPPTRSLPMRTRAATALGHAAAGLSKRLGRGNGSVIGGRVLLAVDGNALARLAAGRRSVVISGTNGKTTTTRMLAAAIGVVGPVVTNVRGANMPPGLAAALSDGEAGAPAVLEVDEAWMPAAARAVRPEVIVLLNLSRDQLDRNTEVRTLSRSWRTAVSAMPDTAVVANADDPLTAWAAMAARTVTWVGAGQPWTADAAGGPACGGGLRVDPPWGGTAGGGPRPPPPGGGPPPGHRLRGGPPPRAGGAPPRGGARPPGAILLGGGPPPRAGAAPAGPGQPVQRRHGRRRCVPPRRRAGRSPRRHCVAHRRGRPLPLHRGRWCSGPAAAG